MKRYQYISINSQGIVQKGLFECNDTKELNTQLRAKGEYLIKASIARKMWSISIKRKAKTKELSLFCKQVGAMLESGISLLDTMQILNLQFQKGMVHEASRQIITSVRKGTMLHEAMRECPVIFPEFMINMIRIGEETGKLDDMFNKLSKHYDKEKAMKNKITGAAAYPVFVLVFTIIATITLMTTMVPSMMSMIVGYGGELPLITRIIMGISIFLKTNLIPITCIIAVIFLILVYLRKNKKISLSFIFRKVPFLNKLYFKIQAYEFLSALYMLKGGGCSVVDSIEGASKVVKDNYLNNQINKSVKYIRDGGDIINALINIEIIDYTSLSIIKLGEETGKLHEMLFKLLAIMEEDLISTLNKLSELIQPAAMLFVGAIVGTVVLSIALPMFSMYNM